MEEFKVAIELDEEDRIENAFCSVGDENRLLRIAENYLDYRKLLSVVAARSLRLVGEEYIAVTDDETIRVSFQATYTRVGPSGKSSRAVADIVSVLLDEFAGRCAMMDD
jgi:hypothetical protein